MLGSQPQQIVKFQLFPKYYLQYCLLNTISQCLHLKEQCKSFEEDQDQGWFMQCGAALSWEECIISCTRNKTFVVKAENQQMSTCKERSIQN